MFTLRGSDPTLVFRSVQLLNCIDVASTGDSVLRSDVRISCSSDLYASFRVAAITFIVLYCLGIPAFLASVLAKSADALVMRGGDVNAPVLLVASDVDSVVKHAGAAWRAFTGEQMRDRHGLRAQRRNAMVPPGSDASAGKAAHGTSVAAAWDRAQNLLVNRRLFDFTYRAMVHEAQAEIEHLRVFSVHDTLLQNARKQRKMEVLQACFLEANDRIERDGGEADSAHGTVMCDGG